ncbi:hypothetical protein Agub_g1543, partial [Astrephomene gubernaculifera]
MHLPQLQQHTPSLWSIASRKLACNRPLTARSGSLVAHCAFASSAFGNSSSPVKPIVVMGRYTNMMLGGHRGMGENLTTVKTDGKLGVYPAFRENTIQSFQQAAKCGVGFVEFDVQVTRDNVPVIWHDDDVVTGPADHPSKPQIKDLTLAELQTLCGSSGRYQPGGSHEGRGSGSDSGGSSSGGDPPGGELMRLFRDRVTRQWGSGYLPWRCDQDDAIPTLEAVFASMPPEIGFDIEIKMTTGDDVVHTPSQEVDRMLGAILPVVHRCSSLPSSSSSFPSAFTSSSPAAPLPPPPLTPQSAARRRRIIFSSFDPDVCVELRRRQEEHPVYYLSGCGLYAHADARRTSIPAALSFAAETGMRGIVVPASVLLRNMDMVVSASRSQLELMTYGLENNDLDSLRAQADAGVVAAIVDEVA